MKRFGINIRLLIAAITLGTSLPLVAGCTQLLKATLPAQVSTAVTTPLCSHTLIDDKGYYSVLTLYNVPAQAYVSADQNGLFAGKAPLKATLKDKLQQLRRYALGFKSAYHICNNDSLLQYKQAMEEVNAEILPLIPHS